MAPHADDSYANGSTVPSTNGKLRADSPAAPTPTVSSPNVTYNHDTIVSKYTYRTTDVAASDGKITATPKETIYDFKTERTVGRVGLMLVGWGGRPALHDGDSYTQRTLIKLARQQRHDSDRRPHGQSCAA